MSACKNCNGSLTLECGEFVFAPCVIVQSTLTEISAFFEEDCVTLHDLIPEIYEFLEFLDLEGYDSKCLDLPEEPTHLEIEQAQTDEICAIKDSLIKCINDVLELPLGQTEDCDIADIDTSCLDGVCGPVTPVNTFGDLIQLLIQTICELESRITTLESE